MTQSGRYSQGSSLCLCIKIFSRDRATDGSSRNSHARRATGGRHGRLAKSGAEIDSNGAETDRHSDRNGLRQPRRDLSLAGGLVVAANCFSTQHDFGCPQPPGHLTRAVRVYMQLGRRSGGAYGRLLVATRMSMGAQRQQSVSQRFAVDRHYSRERLIEFQNKKNGRRDRQCADQ